MQDAQTSGSLELRPLLLKRLIDVAALPASRLSPHERAMAGDLLSDVLDEAGDEAKALCVRRLSPMSEAPKRLLLKLALESVEIATPLLQENTAFDDVELIRIMDGGTPAHQRIIAGRRELGPAAALRIAEFRDEIACKTLIENRHAAIPNTAMDILVDFSRDQTDLVLPLIGREELQPAQAMTMFWWAAPSERHTLLVRFAPERAAMIDACSDLFKLAAQSGWQDPVSRKALQLVERRQRNRAAAARSPYADLEAAIAATQKGFNRQLAEEISHLSGVKPVTGARILADPGGEPIAVLCKATGVKRDHFKRLWVGLRRPITHDGADHPAWIRAQRLYDSLATAKAQTVLRYWNWSFSAAFSAIKEPDADGERSSKDHSLTEAALKLGA